MITFLAIATLAATSPEGATECQNLHLNPTAFASNAMPILVPNNRIPYTAMHELDFLPITYVLFSFNPWLSGIRIGILQNYPSVKSMAETASSIVVFFLTGRPIIFSLPSPSRFLFFA